MSKITTHILDTSLGKPAVGVAVWLEKVEADVTRKISQVDTDEDGRANNLTPDRLDAGHYRLYADIGAYFSESGRETLYYTAIIDFLISADQPHYHLPLLISPYSYSTYRGS